MIDLFPHVRATLKEDSYFDGDLSGFSDDEGRFKVFKGDESPTGETPFISVEVLPGGQDPNNNWSAPFVTFNVIGHDYEWSDLYTIADKIRDAFKGLTCFASVDGADSVAYQLVGEADFGEGRNPVTDHAVVSVALRFGITS